MVVQFNRYRLSGRQIRLTLRLKPGSRTPLESESSQLQVPGKASFGIIQWRPYRKPTQVGEERILRCL